MDTQGELRTKAKAAFVLSGLCLAAVPYFAVAQMPPMQDGGKSNGFLAAFAAGLALLSFCIGILDRHQARSAPVAHPEVSPERRAAAKHDARLLMGGQAILMTVVAGVLAADHHVAVALLSLLSAGIFVGVAFYPTRGGGSRV